MRKRKQFKGVRGPRQLGSNLITDIPVIERISRQSEDDDFDFRVYLKFECDLSDRELDETVRETVDEVWQKIDCTTCANCCKTLIIPVTDGDITRLSNRLKITRAEFSTAYLTKDADGDKVLASQPCVFLGADNRCTVYEDRPEVCRDFPFLYKDDFRSRSLSVIDNSSLCPIVFNVWHRLKQTLR